MTDSINLTKIIKEVWPDEIYNFGLSNCTEEMLISIADNSSSVFLDTEHKQTIELKNIVEFIKEHEINKVELIKINIEGGEYALLEGLIESGLIKNFHNIQLQFHDFIIPNASERMNTIQNKMIETHYITYQYEFVWENWRLRE